MKELHLSLNIPTLQNHQECKGERCLCDFSMYLLNCINFKLLSIFLSIFLKMDKFLHWMIFVTDGKKTWNWKEMPCTTRIQQLLFSFYQKQTITVFQYHSCQNNYQNNASILFRNKKYVDSIQFTVRRCSISREAKRPLKETGLQIVRNGFWVEAAEGENME